MTPMEVVFADQMTARVAAGALPDTRCGVDATGQRYLLVAVEQPPSPQALLDPLDGTIPLVALRTAGARVMSAEGATITWDDPLAPVAIMAPDDLRMRLGYIAGLALLARYMPSDPDARVKLIMGIAGGLTRAGYDAAEVDTLVWVVADAVDESDVEDAERIAASTVQRHRAGEPTRGWPAVGQVVGDAVADSARAWIGRMSDSSAATTVTPERSRDGTAHPSSPVASTAGERATPPPGVRIITTRYDGVCRTCGGSISIGEQIQWKQGERAAHAGCKW